MGEIFKNCYECGKTCINSQFTLTGDTPGSEISLPRTLKIKIIANPAYWGFEGTNDDNVMVSGYAHFSNGYYDFFYGYEDSYINCRTCGRYQDEICSKNDKRPDIGFRTVVDENGEITNYNYNTNDNVTRGGAEIYLLDRESDYLEDSEDCTTSDPETVFKKNPDNFGLGNKILFKDTIYKNITGAWRLSECKECYSNTGYIDNKLIVCSSGNCSGLYDTLLEDGSSTNLENDNPINLESGCISSTSKQHIRLDENFGKFYDPAKKYCSNYEYNYGCLPDGSVPKNYTGELIGLKRDNTTDYFLRAQISYTGEFANCVKNGNYIALSASGDNYDNGYYISEITHHSGYSYLSLFGTYDSGNPVDYTDDGNGTWSIYNTIDPESCCGGAAYGISNTTKQVAEYLPYHVDIKKVFNNAKNKLYSNREKFISGLPREDKRNILTSGGTPILDASGNIQYVGDFSYYGPYYNADQEDTYLRTSKELNTSFKNGTCYTKSQEVTIFPDSLVQSYEYLDCTEGIQHRQNIVPRLTFIYKPCNYNDSCTFNASGDPWTAGASGMPSTLADLKAGFGGQEIVMHLNLGASWGNKTRDPEQCSCADEPPPGEIPFDPEVSVPSPVTFPCLPKFDIRPTGYGCQDPMWYNNIRDRLIALGESGLEYQGQCTETPYDACYIKQPYTTYGYIRNLCGSKDNSRISVLQSLANKQQDGGYTDISGSGEIVEPMYVNFLRPLDDTGLGFPTDGGAHASGVRVNKPYWGLTDNQGRLSFPYFYTDLRYGFQPFCPPDDPVTYEYVGVDNVKTLVSGFPVDEVPFLVEIDHDDYCVGCSSNQIEDKQFYITIESLPAKYLHGTETVDATAIDDIGGYGFKYGFNYCRYPGISAIPSWNSTTDTWSVPAGCNGAYIEYSGAYSNTYAPSVAWTGDTCGCLGDGVTVPLRLHKLEGTNMPKYWSTDGGINSYTALPSGCSEPRGTEGIMQDYTVYFAAFMHCGNFDSVVPNIDSEAGSNYRYYGNLGTLYNCGSCSHSYPATDSKPNLSLDFWYVRKGWEHWFEGYTDEQLLSGSIVNFLENGANFGFLGPQVAGLPTIPWASGLSTSGCSGGQVQLWGSGTTCFDPPDFDACNWGQTGFELAGSYSSATCTRYNEAGTRMILLETAVPGCDGATITLWGYSYRSNPSYTDIQPDAGFNIGLYPNGMGNGSATLGTGSVPATCCDNSCFQGLNRADSNMSSYMDHIVTTAEDVALLGGCSTCDGWKNGCLGVCGGLAVSDNCYGQTLENCCNFADSLWSDDGLPINRPRWVHHCFTLGHETDDEIGSFTWLPASDGCPAGYYGTLNGSHAEIMFTRNAGSNVTRGIFSGSVVAWDGTNIPGLGNVYKAPANEPIARRVTGNGTSLTNANTGRSTCTLDSGPNNTTLVASEFARVKRVNNSYGYDHVYTHMGPVECTKDIAGSTVGGTCVRPIYPNTMASIAAGGSGVTKVSVNKETCHPEIMTVHRIECSGNGYALHVSREYYEHDRTAYVTRKYTTPGPPISFHIDKFPIYGKLDGGSQGVLYENPTGEENPDHYFAICDTGTLDTPPNRILGLYDYPIIIPMMSRSDYISPCYEDGSGLTCVLADEPFYKSLCTSYYDPAAYDGGSGAGASGYFQTDSSGILSFVISNGGSNYYHYDEDGNRIPCAIAIFDNPCVGLSLSVNSGEFTSYEVNGYSIDYDACGTNWPSPCCDDLHGSEEDDCLEDPNYCGGTTLPSDMTWPVSIIGCDATLKVVCDTITDDVCIDDSPIYPNFYNSGSGTLLWNEYNLVYDSGNPDSRFLSDASLIGASFFPTNIPGERAEPFPVNEQIVSASDIKTGFVNGDLLIDQSPIATEETNFTCSYSCIRDNADCGGEFFTNKEFLPRRSYAVGTKVTRYGPLSICAQTAEHGWGNWLAGHVNLSSSIIDTMELGNLNDVKYLPLVDPSRSGAYTVTTAPMGLADDIIYVEELTTLLGAKHPFFKMLEPQGLDSKSCIMPDSGCFNFLPIHNISTTFGMEEERFFSGDDVYYTNKQIIREAIASGLVGESGCLLNPFRIMVDVEPCSERLSHPGTSNPMNLSWVVPGISAGVCRGWLYANQSNCDGTTCDDRINAHGLSSVIGPITERVYWVCPEIFDDPGAGSTFCSWGSRPTCERYNSQCPDGTNVGCDALYYTTYYTFTYQGEEYILNGFWLDGPWSADDDRRESESYYTGIDCLRGMTTNCGTSDITYACNGWTGTGTELDPCVEDKVIYQKGTPNMIPTFGQASFSDIDQDWMCRVITLSRKVSDAFSGSADGCFVGGPANGLRDINLLTDDAYCQMMNEILADFDCRVASSIVECPYPSVLKVTITE